MLLCLTPAVSTFADEADSRPGRPAASAAPAARGTDDAVGRWLEQTVEPAAPRRPLQRNPSARQASLPRSRAGDGTVLLDGGLGLMGPLVVVLGVIAAITVLARRWQSRRGVPGSSEGITLLARQHLSTRQCLWLVRLGRRLVLLGVSPERIQPLVEVADADEAAAIVSSIESRRAGSFSASLARFATGGAEDGPPRIEDPGPAPTRRLAETRGAVRSLLERVQNGTRSNAPAEPA
jgi:flagellar biogenesis protein FliO